jgi:hypothetical protein
VLLPFRPEEMKPFYAEARKAILASQQGSSPDSAATIPLIRQTETHQQPETLCAPEMLYSQLVQLGLLRR